MRTKVVVTTVIGLGLVTLAGCAAVPESWRSAWTQAEPERHPLRAGALSYGAVRTFEMGAEPAALAVSPTGNTVAAAGVDSSFIDVWDVETGARRLRLVGHRLPPIGALQFSADGRLLVSGGGVPETGFPEPSLRVWDITTGRVIDMIPVAQSAEIVSVAVSADAGHVLSASTDSLKMWALPRRTGADGMWVDHTSTICGMAASPDLKVVATGGRDFRVMLRALSDMNRHEMLLGHEAPPCGLRFSPDGTVLVSWDFGSTRSTIRVWDAERLAARGQVDIRGRTYAVFFDGSEPVAAVRGSVLHAGRSEEPIAIRDRIRFVSLSDGRVVGEVPGEPKLVVTSHDGQAVATASWDGTVTVFRRGGSR